MTARTDAAPEWNRTDERCAPAGFATALRAQILLLHRSGRTRILIAAAAIVIVLSIGAEWWFSQLTGADRILVDAIEYQGFTLLSLHQWIVLFAAAWGIAVWWQESPSRREHLLAAPADMTLQELARITAGGLWLVVLLALATVAALLILLAGGRSEVLGTVAPAAWAALVSGPLLAYTLTVTVATATRRSIAWVACGILLMGSLLVLSFRSAFRSAMIAGDPGDAFGAFRYSLFNAVGGLAVTTTTRTSHISDGQTTTVSTVAHGASMMPYWLEASLLWWTIAALALAFVLWRRRRA